VVLALSPVLISSAHDPPKGPSMRQRAGPQVFIGSYLRHSALFPRARIVARHGGIGTSGQALKAGRPQLVTPYLGDQTTTLRAYRGRWTLPAEPPAVRRWRRASRSPRRRRRVRARSRHRRHWLAF